MDTKYYTPELSEFHVGFKYELKCLNTIDYNTRIYGDKVDTPLLNSDESIFESIEEELEDRDIRVKYLDKEDIENCGFRFDNELKFPKGKYKPSITEYVKDGFCISKIHEDGTLLVSKFIEGKFDKLFDGTIKNLSELKVLLKQLGIDENN